MKYILIITILFLLTICFAKAQEEKNTFIYNNGQEINTYQRVVVNQPTGMVMKLIQGKDILTNGEKSLKSTMALPDLFVYQGIGSVNGFNSNSDNILDIETSVKNYGSVLAGSFQIGYYLSIDTIFDKTIDFFIGTVKIGSLAANSYYNAKLTVDLDTVARRIPEGNYFVTFFIDDGDQVVESDEDRNKLYFLTPMNFFPAPLMPVASAAINITQNSFSAIWNASATATGYLLDVSSNNTFNSFVTGYNNKNIGNVTTSSVTGLNANTLYYYRIRAYNYRGTSRNSNTVNVTTLQIPAPMPPVATISTNITQSSFSANWNSSATATGYRLDVSIDNGFTSFVSGYNNKDIGNLTTSSVTGLNANTPYYLRVRAYNSGGISGNSNTITLSTEALVLSDLYSISNMQVEKPGGTFTNDRWIEIRASIIDLNNAGLLIDFRKIWLEFQFKDQMYQVSPRFVGLDLSHPTVVYGPGSYDYYEQQDVNKGITSLCCFYIAPDFLIKSNGKVTMSGGERSLEIVKDITSSISLKFNQNPEIVSFLFLVNDIGATDSILLNDLTLNVNGSKISSNLNDLTVSTNALVLTAQANSTNTFTITSDVNWTVTSNQTWLTASSASGSGIATITVTATANPNAAARTATLTVSGTGVTAQTITVTQNGVAPILTVSTNTVSVVAPANSIGTFSITSNIAWTLNSNQIWLTVSTASGSGNATITLTAQANSTTTNRNATVTVSGVGVTTKTITVTQEGIPDLQQAIIKRASGDFVFDGKADEQDWMNANQNNILKPFKGESFWGPGDLAGYWKAIWKSDGLYVFVAVTADDILGTDGSVGYGWEQDLIEVYFDMNTGNLIDGNGPGSEVIDDLDAKYKGHYQITHARGKSYQMPVWANGILRSYTINGNLGTEELFIPWSTIPDENGNVYVPDSLKPIGFDVCLTDNDLDPLSPRNRLVWSGDGSKGDQNYYNMDNSGIIKLVGESSSLLAPVAIAATNITQSGFSANWNASATATGYRLDVSTINTFTSFVAGYNNKDVGNVITLSATGLNAFTKYYYRIRAYNSGGTSGNSNTINLTTLPVPPPSPVAVAASNITQSGFSVNWNASATATGYRLDVSTSNTFASFVAGYNNKDVGNVITLSATGLNAFTKYYYRIRAYNSGGTSGNSNTINLTTLPVPPPSPVAVAASNITQSGFSANWNVSATATGYRLDVSTSNTFNSFIAGYNNKDVGNVTTSPVIGLNANTPYYYRVRAYNSGGTSSNSNIINTIIEKLPDLTWTYFSWSGAEFVWRERTNITLYLNVVNIGNTSAEPQRSRIYLSTNDYIDTLKAIQLGSDIIFNSINAGDSLLQSTTFTVPSVKNGTYYIGAIVDYYKNVIESEENNNTAVAKNTFTFISSSVVEINKNSDCIIYPNPTNRWLTVESSTPDYTITVYSLEGKILYNKVLYDRVNTIDLNDLMNGLYVIKLENSKNVIIRKIQKL